GILVVTAALAWPASGEGFFSYGYGIRAKGMAGSSVATIGDVAGGASNPAKMAFAGRRNTVGVEFFGPQRTIQRTGAPGAAAIYNDRVKSRNNVFPIPDGGFSRQLNERWYWGATLYANGGLNTEYNDDNGVPGSNANPALCGNRPANLFLGCGRLGVNLNQFVVAPSLAYRPRPNLAFGVAPLLAMQRIKLYGLEAFAPLSRRPGRVTDQGNDRAFGAGVRVGVLWQATDWLRLGGAYASTIHMQEFDRYKGLFAGGTFDIPENFSLGFALTPSREWELSFHYQKIYFSDVPAIGNSVLNSILDPVGKPLGSSQGSGFHWDDTDDYRVGLEYHPRERLTLRVGYAYSKPPTGNDIDDVSLTLLAPGVGEHTFTLGGSWQLQRGQEAHIALRYTLPEHVAGPSATTLLGVGGRDTLRAEVWSLAVGWSWP
ncbi:MAG: outer membrane protein transport protein, partial [Pseudomonadota bacterium]|nr:outer membrane protein transport protein [Pseudomonadota bacterium]